MKFTWKHTLYASYTGYITQAIVNNLAPLLFLIFQKQYNIDAAQLGLLVGFNFTVQMLVDFLAAKYASRLGYRPLIVAAHIFCGAGLVCLGIFPGLSQTVFHSAFPGLLFSVFLYALGGGLIEVLISPIVEALPGEEKESAMSMLHSFYCWGHMFVVLISTLFFQAFTTGAWMWLPLLWAAVPFCNALVFRKVPLRTLEEANESAPAGLKSLFSLKLIPLFFLLMICSGAAEQAMSQWASYFAESSLGISKTLGDLMGPCMFALFMGLSRLYYGKKGSQLRLGRFILLSCALCAGGYLLAALSPWPILALAGCALCGFSVGIFWPGTFSLAARHCPAGGTAMFALLALAGDIGCAAGPAAAGFLASSTGSMTPGLLFSILFPLLIAVGIFRLFRSPHLN